MASAAVADDLTIKVLKTERSSSDTTYLLLQVDNASNVRLDTRWSCVFMNNDDPVFEQERVISNVPLNGSAVKRTIYEYGGPFRKVNCRLMSKRNAS